MPDRRGCCIGCPEVEDDFERANSDELGFLWYPNENARIIDGTLEIDSGYVICTRAIWDVSGGSFLLQVTLDDPVDDSDIYDVVLLKNSGGTFTEKYRIRFDPDTTSGYWTIGFKAVGEGSFWTDAVELISGCGTYQEEYLGVGRQFSISYDRLAVRVGGVTASFPHYEFWRCLEDPDWTHIALGHGGGPRAIRFEAFWMSDHWVHNRDCPFWGCVCGGVPA